MDFIAIDIKNANENKSSICFVSIAIVKNNKIIEEKKYYVKPKDNRFNELNSWVNKINAKNIAITKDFSEVWTEIKHYFENTLVVGHRINNKIESLKKTLDLYEIDYPTFTYISISKLVKKFYTNIKSLKLNSIAKSLELMKVESENNEVILISEILIKITEELNSNSIKYISEIIGVNLGQVSKGNNKLCLSINNAKITSRLGEKVDNISIENEVKNYFLNEVVVFTGGLSSMKRHEAMELVRKKGGSTAGTINKKVTVLVVAVKDINLLSRPEMSSKLRKAIDLNKKGQEIKILTENTFLNLIN